MSTICCCTTCAITGTVKDCAGVGVSGAVVTFRNSSTSAVVGTATSGSGGAYSASLSVSTGPNVTGSVVYNSQTMTLAGVFAATCARVVNFTIGRVVAFAAKGLQGQYLDGVAVTVSGAGSSWSGTANGDVSSGPPYFTPNASGAYILNLLPGVYTYTLARTRFQTFTGSLTINTLCGTTLGIGPGLAPAAPYVELSGYNVPVTPSLNGTLGGHSYPLTVNGSGGAASLSPTAVAFTPGATCCTAAGGHTARSIDSYVYFGVSGHHLLEFSPAAATFPSNDSCPDGSGAALIDADSGVTQTFSEAPAFSYGATISSRLYDDCTTAHTLLITE